MTTRVDRADATFRRHRGDRVVQRYQPDAGTAAAATLDGAPPDSVASPDSTTGPDSTAGADSAAGARAG